MSGENQANSEAGIDKAPAGWVLFGFGFRPFFLMAGLFSVLATAAWLGVYFGGLPAVSSYPPSLWHAHEMLFGFTLAAATGFLLTAVPNWTGAPPVRGGLLAALTAVWLAGRIAVWAAPSVPLALAAVIDIAFIPFLAAVVLPALLRGKGRNLVFMVVLGLLTVANLLFHLEAVGIFAGAARGTTLAVDSIALLIAIIGGRVTPAFTANVLRFRAMQGGPQLEVTVKPWLNQTAIASIAAVIAVDLVAAGSFIAGLVALAAAALNGWRMAGWQTAAVLRLPIMWVLHLGYGWLVLGLAVKGLAPLTEVLPASVALHGITIGAIGTMTLALMSRASLGHTGRPLAAPRAMALAYALPSLAALVRLVAPLAAPELYDVSVMVSGLLWGLGFAIFAVLFWPILTRPRVDERPG